MFNYNINYKSLKVILSVVIGVVFLSSGILKMISIYDFELYIFSFSIFSFDFSSLLARLVIGFEMALGFGYMINIYHKPFYYTILYTLIAFTIFLIILVAVGRDDNCRCFGELVSLDPVDSIIKNVFLIAIVIYTKDDRKYILPVNKNIALAFCLLIVVIPIAINPPNKIRSLFYSSSTINQVALDDFVISNDTLKLGSHVKMLCFYSTSCHYCELASQQVSQIVINNRLDPNKIMNFFWDDKLSINEFYDRTKAVACRYKIIDITDFLDITDGNMPTIILLEDGGKATVFDYHTIDERLIVEALLLQ
ncbi:MAG: hypothetical protein RRZ64_02470 [Rikenellaceae bacterium]